MLATDAPATCGLGGGRMRVFLWQYVENATNNYHSGGGVFVIAETEARARELANAIDGCCIGEYEDPTEVLDVLGGREVVYIMQDAGCC